MICGGISNYFIHPLVKANIRVIGNLCGEYEEILETFKKNEVSLDKFLIPGCCKRQHGKCRRQAMRNRNCKFMSYCQDSSSFYILMVIDLK